MRRRSPAAAVELCTPVLMEPLARVARSSETSADKLLAAT